MLLFITQLTMIHQKIIHNFIILKSIILKGIEVGPAKVEREGFVERK